MRLVSRGKACLGSLKRLARKVIRWARIRLRRVAGSLKSRLPGKLVFPVALVLRQYRFVPVPIRFHLRNLLYRKI